MSKPTKVFDGASPEGLGQLGDAVRKSIQEALAATPPTQVSSPIASPGAGPAKGQETFTQLAWDSIKVSLAGLEGLDRAAMDVLAVLRSGHHVILLGPPGTGKTELAEGQAPVDRGGAFGLLRGSRACG
jgi:hypothetical protein